MQITKWVAGIGASFLSLRAVTGSLMDAAENIDRIAKGADKIGITTQSFVALDHAAKLAGASMEQIEDAIGKLQRGLVDAETKGGKAAEAFTNIGLSVTELKSLTPDKQFEAVADAVSRIPDAAERAAVAFKIFGRASQDLLPLLLEGSAGIEKARKETEAYGLAISRMDAKQVERMNDAVTRLKAAWSGWSFSVVSYLAGPAADLLEFWTEWMVDIQDSKTLLEALDTALMPFKEIAPAVEATRGGAGATVVSAEEQARNLKKIQDRAAGAAKGLDDVKKSTEKLTDQLTRLNAEQQEFLEGQKTIAQGGNVRQQSQMEQGQGGGAVVPGRNARQQEMLERGIRPDDGFRIEDPALKATDSFLAQFEAAEQARKGALQNIRDGGVGGTFSARAAGQMAGGRLEQLAAEQVNWLKKIDEAIKGLFPVYGA